MATATVPVSLPWRLRYFLTRFPPELYSASATRITIPLTKKAAKEAAASRLPSALLDHEGKVSYQYSQPIAATIASPVENTPTSEPSTQKIEEGEEITPTSEIPSVNHFPPNPFLPRKNFTTGRWAGAKFGLRQQADLVKLAKKFNVEHLLPPGRKSTVFKETRLLERGLRIRGTGEGEKVKGHKWERTMGTRLEKRREAMEKMPALIKDWESRGHGRGWKKYPKPRS